MITGVPGEEIRVKAERQVWGDDSKGIVIDASKTPGRVEVRTLFGNHKNKAEVDYTVEVPYETSVTAHSLSGDIKVVKVRGELQLDTTNGNIEAMGTPRLVRLKSFSGNVVVTDAGAADVPVGQHGERRPDDQVAEGSRRRPGHRQRRSHAL